MRVLVTGGCGFIGSHIVYELAARGYDTLVVDNLSTGRIENLHPAAKFINVDITSSELRHVFESYRPEIVYHEAAQIDVQSSIKDAAFDAKVNILGSINLLECCRDYNVRKIIYASSAAVYGEPQYLGIDEKHPLNPVSFYGISKLTPEKYIGLFCRFYNIKYTILRYANVYGIHQSTKGESGVISIFLDKILKYEPPIIFGDGEQTRDFIYVRDVALANLNALEAGDGEIINISSGKAVSITSLYRTMKKLLNFPLEPIYKETRRGDIIHSYLCNEKANDLLAWRPQYPLEDGLKEMIDFSKKQS